jgi:LysR family transcriptional regulator, hydrogen peroxide-inducible genes activator
VLPKVLPDLQANYPDLIIELRETQTKVLLEELAGGDLDAVMLALPLPAGDIPPT